MKGMSHFNFIKTQDEDTAKKLTDEGLQFSHMEGNFYVFVNNLAMKFTKNDQKVVATNKICF